MSDSKILDFERKKKDIKRSIDEELRSLSFDDLSEGLDIDDPTISSDDIIDFGNSKLLNELNENHAYIINYGGKSAITMNIYDPINENRQIVFQSVESFQSKYCNRTVSHADKIMEVGRWWVKHPYRREYDTVFFDPQKPKEFHRCLNMWSGFGVTPKYKRRGWFYTLQHIKKILCNGDKAKFRYFIKWLAWTVQNPGVPAEVAVVFKGRQGAGKGFIFSQMVKIFGKHGMNIANRKHLTGQFNSHLAQLCFMFADEAYYPGDKEVEGVLKQLITEPTFAVEGKFRDTMLGKNCLHIGMSTNNDWVIPATHDSRRFFINTVENIYAKGVSSDRIRTEYFSRLWGEMNDGGREAMLYDLLKIKLKNWHPRYGMPSTAELKHQIELSLPRPALVIRELLDTGVLNGFTDDHINYYITAKGLSEQLDEIMPKHGVHIVAISTIIKSIGGRSGTKNKKRCWIFPKLADCRFEFSDKYGEQDWSTESFWQVNNTDF